MVNNTISEVMTYPMALAKQANFKFLDPEDIHIKEADEIYPIQLPEDAIRHIYSLFKEDDQCDFQVHLRSSDRLNWFFGNGTIAGNQYDIRLMAARAFTRALGFSSTYNGMDRIRPETYWFDDPSTTFFSYMSPMDGLIWGTGMRSHNLAAAAVANCILCLMNPIRTGHYVPFPGEKRRLAYIFNKYNRAGLNGKNMTDRALTRSQRKYLASIEEEFQSYEDWRMVFQDQTSLRIGPYSEMNLLRSYQNTEEFLMSPATFLGQSLETLMNLLNNGKLYGPLTMKALEEIGHVTEKNTHPLEFYTANKTDTGFFERKPVSPFMASLKLKMGL